MRHNIKTPIFAAKLNRTKERKQDMATAIRAIPTLYGETARHFELEAAETEENPGTLDYTHEAEIVMEYLKCTGVL